MAAGKRDKTLTRGSMNYEKNRGRAMDFYFKFADDIFYILFNILYSSPRCIMEDNMEAFSFFSFIKFAVNK